MNKCIFITVGVIIIIMDFIILPVIITKFQRIVRELKQFRELKNSWLKYCKNSNEMLSLFIANIKRRNKNEKFK